MRRGGFVALLAAVLAVARSEAQVIRPVLSVADERDFSVAIDDAGTTVYAVTTTNQFGTNPNHRKQIVRWDAATGVGTPITDYDEGVESVSVSDDGTWLAFVSSADLLGTNHDESPELYVMHPDGTGLAQLTSGSFLPTQGRGVRVAVISGSANRIVFVGRINPLGLNAAYTQALFVIDRDGSNLRQLQTDVSLPSEFPPGCCSSYDHLVGIDISDDGGKIVYLSSNGANGINADGTSNHGFSGGTGVDCALSGNGEKIVYAVGDPVTVRARAFDGSGTVVTLGNGKQPTITDDATLVYFYRTALGFQNGIWKVASTGSTPILVAAGLVTDRIAGGGGRLVARGTELVAIDNDGGNLKQLTTTTLVGRSISEPTLSSDASAIRFSSTIDPLGTNPGHALEQFSYDLGTGAMTQLTDATLPAVFYPAFSDAGDLFFPSTGDLTGQNSCGSPQYQLFRRDSGGFLTQLTSCALPYLDDYPAVRADGQVVVYYGWDGAPTPRAAVFAANADGSGMTLLAGWPTFTSFTPDGLAAAGTGPTTWVAFVAYAGTQDQVFRVKSDGTGRQQITSGSYPAGPARISADGNVIAWSSQADYTGQNHDHSYETFIFKATTQTIQQISDPNLVPVYFPRVTQNGQWVFVDDGRYNVATGVSEPVMGFHHAFSKLSTTVPDATGSRWIVQATDIADHDPSYVSLFLADMNAVPAFVVDKASPTVLSWDPSPTSLRYDVIRGSISNLSIAGSTVNLGPVSCLEDDSPDNHTLGYGDPSDPAPGQAFFFLYRGSVGFGATAGSYGQGAGGRERVSGAGGCNP